MLASIRDWLAVCVCLETCDLTMYNFQREKPTAFRRVYHPGVVGITSCPNEACTPRGPHAQAYLAKSVPPVPVDSVCQPTFALKISISYNVGIPW
jgi:hypothetical protein